MSSTLRSSAALPDPDSATSQGKTPWWARTSVLSAIIFAAILLNNSPGISQSLQYEKDDYATNSLQVLKAKRFLETLGNYSRYGFHHPGPAFFYVFAWGEIFFSDATHLVRSPFNGQLIALCGLSAFFFSATLALIARHIGNARKWFLSVALLLAAWHFGAVGKFYEFIPGHPGFFCLWPPCLLVLPFLCFLVAVASVGCGAGRDLPLMILAGCFLVHGHVAMPLFVGPLALLGYGGLIRRSRTSENRKWPWQLFPRQHWVAGATIILFLIPIVVDLISAHPNNFQRIVHHLQTSYGERKSLLQSSLYFVHFGAYSAYPNTNSIPAFETFDLTGILLFFRLHWRAFGLWLAVIVFSLMFLRRSKKERQFSAATGYETDFPVKPELGRFVGWICLVLLCASALSLLWGCLQEGPMFYFNSLFNFAIYYGWLLVFAIGAALWLEDQLSHRRWHLAAAGPILLALVAIAAFVHEARRFRAALPDQAQQRFFAASVERALRLDPAQPKFLNFEWQAGGQTARLALYLERIGCRWMVREDWPLYFREDRIVRSGRTDQPVPTLSSSFWTVVLRSSSSAMADDPGMRVLPLTDEFDLVIRPAK
jgi:hypothetical protein